MLRELEATHTPLCYTYRPPVVHQLSSQSHRCYAGATAAPAGRHGRTQILSTNGDSVEPKCSFTVHPNRDWIGPSTTLSFGLLRRHSRHSLRSPDRPSEQRSCLKRPSPQPMREYSLRSPARTRSAGGCTYASLGAVSTADTVVMVQSPELRSVSLFIARRHQISLYIHLFAAFGSCHPASDLSTP